MVAGLPLLHKTPFVLDPPAFAGSHQMKWTVRADNCGIERQHKRAPRKVPQESNCLSVVLELIMMIGRAIRADG